MYTIARKTVTRGRDPRTASALMQAALLAEDTERAAVETIRALIRHPNKYRIGRRTGDAA